MRNHSNENDFDLHENGNEGDTHFHMNGFARRLVLKQRQIVTRKWKAIRPTYICTVARPLRDRKTNHCKTKAGNTGQAKKPLVGVYI